MTNPRIERDDQVAYITKTADGDRLFFNVKDSIDHPGYVVFAVEQGESREVFTRISVDDALNFGAALVKVALYVQDREVQNDDEGD